MAAGVDLLRSMRDGFLGAEFLGLIIMLPGTFPSSLGDKTAFFAAAFRALGIPGIPALGFPALERPDGAIVKQDKQHLDEK